MAARHARRRPERPSSPRSAKILIGRTIEKRPANWIRRWTDVGAVSLCRNRWYLALLLEHSFPAKKTASAGTAFAMARAERALRLVEHLRPAPILYCQRRTRAVRTTSTVTAAGLVSVSTSTASVESRHPLKLHAPPRPPGPETKMKGVPEGAAGRGDWMRR